MVLDPRVDIGHVHLKVADLDRALAFWRDVLGFEEQARIGDQAAFISAGGYHHHIGLNTWESQGGSPPPPGHTGLYHVAIRFPDRKTLAEAVARVLEAEPNERPIQVGDIIVQDRRANRTDSPSNTWRFDDSQTNQGDMHGDIVVDVDRSAAPPLAEIAGGNVGDSARRRRFPLNADGTLVVDRAHNFRQQRDNGTFQALPFAGSAAGSLDDLSTRRIFTVLSPVEESTAIPGQQAPPATSMA